MRSVTISRFVCFSLFVVTTVVGCSQSASTDTADDISQASTTTTVVMNDYCPIMGGKVTDEGGTVVWNGKTIGFCCDGCDEKWQALSEGDKSDKFAAAQAKTAGHADHEDHHAGDHDHS